MIFTDGSVNLSNSKAAFAVHIPGVGLIQLYRFFVCVCLLLIKNNKTK